MIEDYASLYAEMHKNQKVFLGKSIRHNVTAICRLVTLTRPERILDYGSGKGYQYLTLRLHEQWGGILPHCYDPGVVGFSKVPDGTFDGVICTDVMEHIAPGDINEVLGHIFGLVSLRSAALQSFVFFSICCRPARKKLPDGRNAHLTVKPPEFWDDRINRHRRDGLIVQTAYELEAIEA